MKTHFGILALLLLDQSATAISLRQHNQYIDVFGQVHHLSDGGNEQNFAQVDPPPPNPGPCIGNCVDKKTNTAYYYKEQTAGYPKRPDGTGKNANFGFDYVHNEYNTHYAKGHEQLPDVQEVKPHGNGLSPANKVLPTGNAELEVNNSPASAKITTRAGDTPVLGTATSPLIGPAIVKKVEVKTPASEAIANEDRAHKEGKKINVAVPLHENEGSPPVTSLVAEEPAAAKDAAPAAPALKLGDTYYTGDPGYVKEKGGLTTVGNKRDNTCKEGCTGQQCCYGPYGFDKDGEVKGLEKSLIQVGADPKEGAKDATAAPAAPALKLGDTYYRGDPGYVKEKGGLSTVGNERDNTCKEGCTGQQCCYGPYGFDKDGEVKGLEKSLAQVRNKGDGDVQKEVPMAIGKKPEQKKAEAKPEEKKADVKPEEKKTDTQPEQKKADAKPDEKKADAKPDEKKDGDNKDDKKPDPKAAEEAQEKADKLLTKAVISSIEKDREAKWPRNNFPFKPEMNWFEKKQKAEADAKKADEDKDKDKQKDGEKKVDEKKDDKKVDEKKPDAKADDKKAEAKPDEKKVEAKPDEKKVDAKADEKKEDDKKAAFIQLSDHVPPPDLHIPPTPTFLDKNNCEHVYTSPRKVEDFGLEMDALCPRDSEQEQSPHKAEKAENKAPAAKAAF